MSDAWRYCENLTDPEAVKLLVQAALSAHGTIHFAITQVNPEEFGTVPDWATTQRRLKDALKAIGHPAGDRITPSHAPP
jgi:hypothetical protein